jgi:hypothetical protein
MDDNTWTCAGCAIGTIVGIGAVILMAVVLTWERVGARRLKYCPYCVAVADTDAALDHCWRCGGRYDKGRYSLDWDAVNLDLFRNYHGRNPDGYMEDPRNPHTDRRRPEPPDDSYRKDPS